MRVKEVRGLVLFGPSGTGKDHLLSAVMYHVAGAGIPVAAVRGEDIYMEIRDSMDTHEREQRIIEKFLRPALLGISDPICPRAPTLAIGMRVFSAELLIDGTTPLRPTWLTMNAVNLANAQARLTGMIWDRFAEGAEIIPCFWQSYRSLKNKPAAGIKIETAS